ncbi:30692_t:CDS:2, partial [Gigaspora margarita]
MARQKLRTKEWKTNYKHKYRAKKQRRTKYENCYNDNLHTATNNTSWWDNLNTLDKTALSLSVFLWNRRCNYCSTALLTGELSEFCSIGVQGQFVTLPAPSTLKNKKIPNDWVSTIRTMLIQVNPYINFKDEIDENEEENLHLSASFLGSKRWCSSHVANALALARSLGKLSFFITMTTNPNWEEIHSQLQPGQNALEITPIVVYSFHSRFKKLKELIRTYFEKVIYIIEVIEFQKRGFSHAHVIVCVQSELPINQIDKIIMAELPREKSLLRELVEKYMIHKQQHSPRCLRNRKCIYNYPKPIIPETHVNEKGFIQYRRHMQEDLWVVPYNPMLISKLECHINFEIASTVNLFIANSMPNQHINEFEDYINGRYLSATEAAWRIFRYPITMSDPSILALPIHLPNANIPQYTRYQNISSSVSLLDRYFLRPLDSFFTQLKYTEYYENYILYPFNPNTIHKDNFVEQEHPNVLKKTVQKRTTNKITRIVLIAPGASKLFYLRTILLHRAVRSWNDLKIMNRNTYNTYQEVAREIGLFANESESILTMKEAIDNFYTLAQLRFLFTQLMLDGALSLELWERYENNFLVDYQEQLHGNHSLATNMTLQEIALMPAEHGRHMRDFGLPEPHSWTQEVTAKLQCYSNHKKYKQLAEKFYSMMTSKQAIFYEEVIKLVLGKEKKDTKIINKFPIFLDGKAGQGKTFLINAICYKIRAAKKIILICGTTALSALLYEGGCTAHSLFCIPVEKNNSNIQSTIKLNSNCANLLQAAELIEPFGGKPLIDIGDFRQVVPVVKGASKSSTINASIKTSHLWKNFNIFILNQPIRNANDPYFAEFVDDIGKNYIDHEVLINIFKTTQDIKEAISFLYSENTIPHDDSLQQRAFLSPRNALVDDFNYRILNKLPGITHMYFSYDVVRENDEIINDHSVATPDYLTQLTYPGIPNHEIHLKIGAVCSVMRNISVEKGL